MKPEQIEASTAALVERFHAVLYPFPMENVLAALPSQGWIVPFVDRDENGIKLAAAPSKGDLRLVFDANLKTFGVRGIQEAPVVEEFRAIRQFLVAKYELAPEVESYFTEFRFVGTADLGTHAASRKAPELLDDWWSGHERSDSLSRQLTEWLPGEPLGAYGIRIATKGKDANRADWSELTIAPSPSSGTRYYSFDLVYRNRDRRLVEGVASKATALISAAVEEIDR